MVDANFLKHGVIEEGAILDLRSIQNDVRAIKEALYPVNFSNLEVIYWL